jgi:hypothetical protein
MRSEWKTESPSVLTPVYSTSAAQQHSSHRDHMHQHPATPRANDQSHHQGAPRPQPLHGRRRGAMPRRLLVQVLGDDVLPLGVLHGSRTARSRGQNACNNQLYWARGLDCGFSDTRQSA